MKTALLFFAALAAALPAGADETQDREALIALLSASVAARALVSTSVDECTARYADMVDAALDAKMEWDARNQPLEERSRAAAARLGSQLAAKTSYLGYEVMRKELLAAAETQTVGNVRETMARSFAASTEPQRVAACRDLVKSVHDGKMDFAITQPQAWKLLQSAR